MPSPHLRSLLVFPIPIAVSAWGQVSRAYSPDGKPLSQRVVAYWIDASVNTDAKSLDASEILEYRNPGQQPVTTIPFHLYLNAFRPQSTFSRESHQDGTDTFYRIDEQGSIDIKKHRGRRSRRHFKDHAVPLPPTMAIKKTTRSWKSPYRNRWLQPR